MADDFLENTKDTHWDLSADRQYRNWRELKLENSIQAQKLPLVEIKQLKNPTDSECAELLKHCQMTNSARYSIGADHSDSIAIENNLRQFASRLKLNIAEKHRSANASGIVALTMSDNEHQRGYIPYSDKAMNWHTDGYYNSPDEQIGSMVLHCVNPANKGGRNQFLDPEIAYIRLRDENPDFIAALMNKEAMTIPENREKDGTLRPVSIGPVFSISPSGQLAMRYTARTRSISWRDDAITGQAAAYLQNLLEDGDPLMQTVNLEAGHGVLCNNVLHNRTGFAGDKSRLIFRVRFHNRVGET